MGVLVREVAPSTRPSPRAGPRPCPSCPVQYADYAVWQRQWLQGEALERQLSYWRSSSPAPPRLELPTDRPRPAVQTYPRRPASRRTCPARSSDALKCPGQREGVTPFMPCSPPSRCCSTATRGQDGHRRRLPHRRPHPRRARGPHRLLRQHPRPAHPPGRRPLRSASCCSASARPPSAPTPTRTSPSRSSSRSSSPSATSATRPLFQVMFVLRTCPPQRLLQLPGLQPARAWSSTPAPPGSTSRSPLRDTPRASRGSFEYSTDLFDASTIAAWSTPPARWWRAWWPHPSRASPSCRCSPRPSASSCWWSGTPPGGRAAPSCTRSSTASSRPRCAALPSACPALRATQQLTYGELDARANQLARHLRRLGRGPRRPRRPLPRALPRTWSSACSPSSRPAAPTSPRPLLPASAWPSCSTTPGRPSSLTHSTLRAPASRTAAASTSVMDAGLGRAWRAAARGTHLAVHRGRRQPRLRHLHLGLHRPAQGRRRSRTAPLVNFLASMARDARPRARRRRSWPSPRFSFDIAALELFLPLARRRPRRARQPRRSPRRRPPASSMLAAPRRHRHAGHPRYLARCCWRRRLGRRAGTRRSSAAARRCPPDLAAALWRRGRRASGTSTARPSHHLVDLRSRHRSTPASRVPIGRPIANTAALRARRAPAAGARRASPASCTSAARAWRAATSAARTDRRALRARPLRRRRPARASTAPATSSAGGPTARSSSSAASTTR